jgi:O-antigen ligase
MRSETASPYLREPAGPGLAPAIAFLALVGLAALCGTMLAVGEVQAMFVTLAIVGAVLVLYDFRIGAVLLLVLLPFSNSAVFPRELMGMQGLNPINLLALATIASFVLQGGLARIDRLLPLPLVLIYLPPILLAAYLGSQRIDDIAPVLYETMLVDYNTPAAYLIGALLKPMQLVVVAMLVAAAVMQSDKAERFLGPLVLTLGAFALILIGYVLVSGVGMAELSRADARAFYNNPIGMHANELGRLFLMGYALLLFTWWETKRPGFKTLLAVTIGLVMIAMVLTFSRAAVLGFLVVNALFLLWKFNARSLSLLIVSAILALAFMPEALYQRITLGFDSGDIEEVSAGRVRGLWLPLLPELWQTPPWGNGLRAIMWSDAMNTGAIGATGHPHNAYLRAALDMGFVGLVLMLAYFATVWRGFRSLGANPHLSPELRGFFQGAAAGLVAFLVTNWAGSSLLPAAEWTLLWIAIGMMYGTLARRPAG